MYTLILHIDKLFIVLQFDKDLQLITSMVI